MVTTHGWWRRWPALLSAAAAVVFACSPAGPSSPQPIRAPLTPARVALTGTVTDALDGFLVAQATIEVRPAPGVAGTMASATSDSSGHFEVPVAEGHFTMSVSHESYQATSLDVNVDGPTDVQVPLLLPITDFTGRVWDYDAAEAPHCYPVVVGVLDGHDAGRSATLEDRSDQGRFVFEQMQPGDFTVRVSAPGYLLFEEIVQLRHASEIRLNLERIPRFEGDPRPPVVCPPDSTYY